MGEQVYFLAPALFVRPVPGARHGVETFTGLSGAPRGSLAKPLGKVA